ncbi:hypothetical protein AB0H88_49020, partial [Nonomuraea sp. NPDC050680]|uniref:hypothetical protein n=1 Tax=Nonomuraea sp. NPDC050680 TaxID=3154630 RepID=UPI0033D42B76
DTSTLDQEVVNYEEMGTSTWPPAATRTWPLTAFEIYLEQALDEALGRIGLTIPSKPNRPSPEWKTLVHVIGLLGVAVETERVRYIRALRHLLVHQRGELRTEALREAFPDEQGPDYRDPEDVAPGAENYLTSSSQVRLPHELVVQVLEDLGGVVESVDRRAWEIEWGMPPAERAALRAQLHPDDS